MSDSTGQTTAAAEISPARSLAWAGWMLLAHVITGAVLMIALVKVVPEFCRIFEDFDAELPRMSVLVIVLSNLVACYWYLLFPLAVVVDAAILFGLSRLPSKARWLSTLWTRLVFVAAILLMALVAVAMLLPLAALLDKLS